MTMLDTVLLKYRKSGLDHSVIDSKMLRGDSFPQSYHRGHDVGAFAAFSMMISVRYNLHWFIVAVSFV